MKLNKYQMFSVFSLVVLSYNFFDQPLALFVEKYIRSNSDLKIYSSNIPSMLFALVISISSICWAIYGYMHYFAIKNKHRDFCLLVGTSLPLAFLIKTILKWIFGRVSTRTWVMQPQDYSLHWFDGLNGYDAFPSGHMLVITQIFMAVWYFYPRLRAINFIIWSGLAITLVITNYHFLSDVIAGAYIGILLYSCCSRYLNSLRPLQKQII